MVKYFVHFVRNLWVLHCVRPYFHNSFAYCVSLNKLQLSHYYKDDKINKVCGMNSICRLRQWRSLAQACQGRRKHFEKFKTQCMLLKHFIILYKSVLDPETYISLPLPYKLKRALSNFRCSSNDLKRLKKVVICTSGSRGGGAHPARAPPNGRGPMIFYVQNANFSKFFLARFARDSN